MTEGVHQPQPPGGGTASAVGSPSQQLVNPHLSGSLTADHEALKNDLLQAQDLAADFRQQLAGKSNEYAQLKQILEKTQQDLEHLQAGIVELRAERHRLANEAMRAVAFEAKLAKVTGERDRLRIDLEVVRQAMAKKMDEMTIQLRQRDRRIAELVIETVSLRNAKGEGASPLSPEPDVSLMPASAKSAEEPDVDIVRAPPADKPRR